MYGSLTYNLDYHLTHLTLLLVSPIPLIAKNHFNLQYFATMIFARNKVRFFGYPCLSGPLKSVLENPLSGLGGIQEEQ